MPPLEVIKMVTNLPLEEAKDLLFKAGVQYHVEEWDGHEYGIPPNGWVGICLVVVKGKVAEACFQMAPVGSSSP